MVKLLQSNMNKSQSNYRNYVKPNDKFWRQNLIKILTCWYYEDCTWNIDNWHGYGISESDKKRIEREFFMELNRKK